MTGMRTKDEDFVAHLFVASAHSYLLCMTDQGRCYWLKVYEVPEGARTSRGRPVVNLINIGPDEKIAAIVPVKAFDDEHSLVQVTEKGVVKKTSLSAFSRPRRAGIIAINVADGDRVIEAALTDGANEIVLATREGQAIRFKESDVRDMGRVAHGVKGISVSEGDAVVGMVVVGPDSTILTVCENGHGKRTAVSDYRLTRRGAKGVINIRATERNGKVVAVKNVVDEDELMIVSQQGILIRLPIRDINMIGRNTQGVRLINLEEGDRVIDVAKIVQNGDDDEDPEGGPEEGDEEDGGNGQSTGGNGTAELE